MKTPLINGTLTHNLRIILEVQHTAITPWVGQIHVQCELQHHTNTLTHLSSQRSASRPGLSELMLTKTKLPIINYAHKRITVCACAWYCALYHVMQIFWLAKGRYNLRDLTELSAISPEEQAYLLHFDSETCKTSTLILQSKMWRPHLCSSNNTPNSLWSISATSNYSSKRAQITDPAFRAGVWVYEQHKTSKHCPIPRHVPRQCRHTITSFSDGADGRQLDPLFR